MMKSSWFSHAYFLFGLFLVYCIGFVLYERLGKGEEDLGQKTSGL
jgi:hypothetical protein